MRSIDKLREWANALHGVYINQVDHTITVTTGWDAPPDMNSVSLRDHVNGILDGIEHEVEELRDRDYRNGREDAEGAVEFADRLKAAVDKREDVTLFGVDYTALPVDADGVPIHVGNVLEWSDGETFRVEGIGGETLFYIGNNNECEWTSIDLKHHHRAQTVEDVLREMLDALDIDRCDDPDGTIAEYAAKLRLAGDE